MHRRPAYNDACYLSIDSGGYQSVACAGLSGNRVTPSTAQEPIIDLLETAAVAQVSMVMRHATSRSQRLAEDVSLSYICISFKKELNQNKYTNL